MFFWIGFGVRALAPLWAAFESIRFYGLMRRRLRLDLADPIVTNRFLLWGIASLGTASMYGSTLVVILAGPSLSASALEGVRVAGMLTGLVSAIAMWLAFFPPPFYRRRFASGEGAKGFA